MQQSKANDFIPARDFSQYEGSTHINLIEQLQNLSLAGDSQQEVYGNGTLGEHDEERDLHEGLSLYCTVK